MSPRPPYSRPHINTPLFLACAYSVILNGLDHDTTRCLTFVFGQHSDDVAAIAVRREPPICCRVLSILCGFIGYPRSSREPRMILSRTRASRDARCGVFVSYESIYKPTSLCFMESRWLYRAIDYAADAQVISIILSAE